MERFECSPSASELSRTLGMSLVMTSVTNHFSPKSMSNPTLGHPNIEVFGQQYLHNVSFNEMMLRDSQRYQFQMKHFNSFCKTVRSNSSHPVFIEASTPSPPPKKNTTLSFWPLLNLQTVQTTLFRQIPLYICFSWTLPSLKIGFFSEPPWY